MNSRGGRYRYHLVLEYDGTNFSGWQKQRESRTVQGDVLKGLEKVAEGKVIDLQGCGRTDAGVHALAYSAHVETAGRLRLAGLVERLNEALPKDIAVLAVEPADSRFHARHSCLARSYVYHLRSQKSAFGKKYSWWVKERLDIDLMRTAAAEMIGMHDFASFAEKQELKKSTKVLVNRIDIEEAAGQIRIRVLGSHFLWHMVRRMVGILVESGASRLSGEQVAGLLNSPSDLPARHTAPAAGLFFEKAYYDQGELGKALSPQRAGNSL